MRWEEIIYSIGDSIEISIGRGYIPGQKLLVAESPGKRLYTL